MHKALTHYLVFGPNYWAKAPTAPKAMAGYRKAGGSLKTYALYRCHPETYCNEMGDLEYPSTNTPGELRPVRIKVVKGYKVVMLKA